MNWITLIWSVSFGSSLTLALIHVLVWFRTGRIHLAHLAFASAALAVSGIAIGELRCMAAPDPADLARVIRWMHVPLFVLVAGIVSFISLYFRTGRRWLAWAVVAIRFATLVVNFCVPLNVNYRAIGGIEKVVFLGQPVSVAVNTIPSFWNWSVLISSFVLVLFVVDASVGLWKRGGADNRRRAWTIGGSVIGFVLLAVGHAVLIHLFELRLPYMISFFFLAIILAMAYELSHDIMVAARLAAELEESRDQLALAAAAAPLALWSWDIADDRIWVTPEGRKMYGIPPEDELPIERFLAAVHPEDRDGVRQGMKRAIEGNGGGFAKDYRVVLPDQEERWFSAMGRVERSNTGTPLRMRGVSIDSTQRFTAEERSVLMVEAAPYAMLMTDSEGRILLVNRQVELAFGYAKEELVGQSISVLIPERFHDGHADLVAGFLASQSPRQMGVGREVCGRRRDGTEFPAEVGIRHIQAVKHPYVLASVVDISERRKVEQELAEQRSELAHLSRVNSLGQLSGALAHELNQPLSIILSNAQAAQRLLGAEPLDRKELAEILTDIVDEDRRAGEVIKRLRSMLKRGEPRQGRLMVNDVVRDVIKLSHSDLLARGVTLQSILPEGLPQVLADPVQLQQVLLNLIFNGCDAMETLDLPERLLVIETSTGDGMVRASVRDHGCGLPEGNCEKVFEPFFTTKPLGLGIGLSITKSIVEAHCGRLWAEANVHAGTTFNLELPSSPA